MRGWEPYEAPSDQWISVLIGSQARSFHTRSASAPSSSVSPYHLCQCSISDCIPGLDAEFCPCCSCVCHSFPSFSRVGLTFSWTQRPFIHAEDRSCFRTLEINIEEYRRAEIAPIVQKAPAVWMYIPGAMEGFLSHLLASICLPFIPSCFHPIPYGICQVLFSYPQNS